MSGLALAAALVLDALLGEPRWLWDRFPHPVVLVGRAITWLEGRLNSGAGRRLKGTALVALGVMGLGILGWGVERLPLGEIVGVIAAAILIAQRSLSDHARTVANALRMSLSEGRRSVAMIVGRDTREMSEPEVTRAAIESVAENFSDGVIAPAFWYLVAGLPGILIYKAINTADSMIGYRTEQYLEFGWAAARLDDLLNWIPARLSAALIAICHGSGAAWRAAVMDGPKHRSPNAGWPEAAMARVLNIALSGPRHYHGQREDHPFVHPSGARDIGPEEIDAACAVIWRCWWAFIGLALSIGWLVS
ncbi:MAG: adenosylcobinamide-phosphate synthase CbiB [Pseudomonadota bacterium]